MKFKLFVDNGTIFQNENGIWCRHCPSCNSIISNTHKRCKEILMNGIGKLCRKCSSKKCGDWMRIHNCGKNNPFYGKHHSPESIKQIRQKKIGKKHSEETKKLMSKQRMGHKGCIRTEESRLQQSLKMRGKCLHGPVSKETKKKHRVSALNHLEKHGIFGYEDKGAKEYFKYQNQQGYNFIQNYSLKDLGYVVDGYDPIQHIICEYDTPYHNRVGQKIKDKERQENIINYFNSIGKPLNNFIRVNSETKEIIKYGNKD